MEKSNIRKISLLLLASLLTLILAVIDDITGHKIQISFIYILPILLAALFLGRWAGIYMSIFSAVAWLIIDLRAGLIDNHTVHTWNIIVRLSFFMFITYGIAILISTRKKQQELMDFVIHDLRSPLTNIIMGLQSIKEIEKAPIEKVKDMTAISLTSANRLLTLVNSLVDLSKMESGKLIPESNDVSISELIEKAKGQASLISKTKRVEVTSDLKLTNDRLKTDYWLVFRIVINLLSNAIKASPPDSTVTIRAEEKNERILISITDQGPGIPKKWQGKIFDKFYQMEARKEGSHVGSGLGLTFCNMAIKELGGHIHLESKEGVGSTFTISLPR